MAKINCNDGCLDNYSAECVKYTGATIIDPSIPQNTSLNTIVNTLVNSINNYIKVYDTKASVPLNGPSRLIQVTADESQFGNTTLYWWSGTILNLLSTQP